ncbi:nitrilase-related carbon-nitrogen hydrolase [Geminisphaera colitermitum]|uniref:nitrilase-related carbon-nitrogen hydrolase n=1 Tax=Geminisphaera colitermitum TaxID=1148786 RepID=UPI000694A421|nr:nitrilase-related carbon-nitrogen hydrolase [Geminisphaera colitermitum]
MPVAGRTLRLGPLICYEDIFPALARANVRAGADLLVVHTNNGWFGEGDAAYQHAANAVLRAVELRRPVLRSGNSGWSGWVDEFGAIRAVLTRTPDGQVHTDRTTGRSPGPDSDQGTVYFRGHASFPVALDSRWMGRLSVYAQWGDWFVALSAVLAACAWATLRHPPASGGQPPSRSRLSRANKSR